MSLQCFVSVWRLLFQTYVFCSDVAKLRADCEQLATGLGSMVNGTLGTLCCVHTVDMSLLRIPRRERQTGTQADRQRTLPNLSPICPILFSILFQRYSQTVRNLYPSCATIFPKPWSDKQSLLQTCSKQPLQKD